MGVHDFLCPIFQRELSIDLLFHGNSFLRQPGLHVTRDFGRGIQDLSDLYGVGSHTTLMATRNPVNSPVEVGSWNPIIYKALYTFQVVFSPDF